MARFYVLLKGEISQELAEAEIRKFLHPYQIDFVRTEWFSKFESMLLFLGLYSYHTYTTQSKSE